MRGCGALPTGRPLPNRVLRAVKRKKKAGLCNPRGIRDGVRILFFTACYPRCKNYLWTSLLLVKCPVGQFMGNARESNYQR